MPVHCGSVRSAAYALDAGDGEPGSDQFLNGSIFTPRAESMVIVKPSFFAVRMFKA
jgi:hypothetical protein